jgi:hypothetical protein
MSPFVLAVVVVVVAGRDDVAEKEEVREAGMSSCP